MEEVLKHSLNSTVVDAVKYGEGIQFLNLISPPDFPAVKYDDRVEKHSDLAPKEKCREIMF
jgi:hypothetical protein